MESLNNPTDVRRLRLYLDLENKSAKILYE